MSATDFDPQAFSWIRADDATDSILVFERRAAGVTWIVACNFVPFSRDYRIGVATAGRWQEALNTDSTHYAGAGEGNLGGVDAEPVSWDGRPFSIPVRLPGLSVVIFRRPS
jgi:1,4-alpha-glucan branching enzyme